MDNVKKQYRGLPGIVGWWFLKNIVHQRKQKRRLYVFLILKEFLCHTNTSKAGDGGRAVPTFGAPLGQLIPTHATPERAPSMMGADEAGATNLGALSSRSQSGSPARASGRGCVDGQRRQGVPDEGQIKEKAWVGGEGSLGP
jgi:hypothetical protein